MPRKPTGLHATRTRPAAVYETPEQLIGLITAGAKDDLEQLEAFRHAFANELKTPDFAESGGQPLQVLALQLLRICPTDNLGVRFLIPDLRAKRSWENRRER